jgi:drug/metabolite transporter (DMT)-like permease
MTPSPRRAWIALAEMPNIHRAMILAVVSTLCAATTNGIIRTLSGEMHPFEIVFFRSLIGLLIFVPVIGRIGFARLKPRRLGLQLVRGGIHGVSILLFYLALSLSPLAKVSALSFSAPLFATLLALLILGEVIRARRITALVVGFLGTLLIVRPGWGALDIGATAVLVSSAMGGIVSIIIKVLSRTDSSLTTTLFGLLVTTPVALIAAIPVWTTPSLGQLLPLIGIGTISVLSNLCRTQSLKEADITVVAPFEFLALPWVALIGYAYFSEVPDIWTWIGGAIIFVATTYIAYRERHIKSEGSTAGSGVA